MSTYIHQLAPASTTDKADNVCPMSTKFVFSARLIRARGPHDLLLATQPRPVTNAKTANQLQVPLY